MRKERPRRSGARSLIVVQTEKTKLSPSLDFMALGSLPVSPRERHEMVQALENRINALWRAELPPEEGKALDYHPFGTHLGLAIVRLPLRPKASHLLASESTRLSRVVKQVQ
jgi:hypothetical protein